MQYFRAHFGSPPPPDNASDGPSRLVLADPLTMCDDDGAPALRNAKSLRPAHDEAGHGNVSGDGNGGGSAVLVALRGGCSFAEKAILAEGAGAGGILFVNSDDADGNGHLSGPEAQDVRLSANMIGKRDGDRILESAARLADAVGNGPPALLGRFVPVGCVDRKSRTLPHIDANCAPVRSADRTFVDGLGYRGRLATTSGGGFSADYVQAEFGGGGVGLDDGRKFRLVSGGGDDFCSGGGGEGNATERRSYLGGGGDGDDSVAVLVDRGGCDFAAKAEAVSRAVAGAGLVILINRDETEFRMGVNTRSRGRDIRAAAVMVSRGAGRRLEELLNPKIGDDDEDDDSGGLSDVFLTLRGTTERTEATCPDETDAARSCA